MLKYFVLFILLIHSLIHLMGFSKAFGYAELKELTQPISKGMGVWWLIACIVLIISTLLWFWRIDYWWMIAFIGLLISQIVIFTAWQDAKFGTFANILLLVLVIFAYADWQFNRQINVELKSIKSGITPEYKSLINKELTKNLPPIVQKWLIKSKVIGKEKIHTVQLKQVGKMLTKPNGDWINFEAEQFFNVDKPAFIWKTNIQANPFFFIAGRDKFEKGQGNMFIKAFSVFPMVNATGKEVDQGTMLRYLAEMCWFPSAALNEYIHWESLDVSSAQATMKYGRMQVSGTFFFTPDGDVKAFEAMRYGDFNGKFSKEKWHIENTAHKDFEGIRVPSQSIVTWKLKEGDYTWLKLEIKELTYNVK